MSKATKMILCATVVCLLSVLQSQLLTAGGSIAKVSITSDAILWEPLVEFRALTLTVAGPGDAFYTKVVEAGDEGRFDLEDGNGNPLPDGSYKYQMTATPIVSGGDSLGLDGIERQSGAFSILAGGAVLPAEEGELGFKRPPGPKELDVSFDQVFCDDVIVNCGSLCVGFDCVNGESFGFDTIKLKENNLRIKFDDTSSTASFPSRDWQILVNDSSNGGLERFSIEDVTAGRIPFTIEGNAPTNSLYVEDSGEIGLGTNQPVVNLHIKDGNTPTVRLEQDGSSGFTPQTWDLAGNETNFFIRDATNGSTLPFRIRPGAPSSSIDIAANGNIGIGTSSPDGDIDGMDHRSDTDGFVEGLRIHNQSSGAGALTQMGFHRGAAEGGDDWLIGIDTLGHFEMNLYSGSMSEFDLDTSGNLIINGTITTGGGTCGGGCDAVFEPGYDLPTIGEHAEQMWENGHLPNVGPTVEGQPIDLTNKVGRMLNELETSHIYIEQLLKKMKALQDRVDRLEAQR